MGILELAEQNQQEARKVLHETGVIPAWERLGATVNIVGSLRSGLLMKNLDIDLHIYTTTLDIAESFSVVQELAARLPLLEIVYKNGIDTDEECIEWHALYEAGSGNVWKFDMIHMRKGAKYEGTVERVTDAIINRLTPELRRTILRIKYDVPEGLSIPGIEIYRAVFSGNVKTYEALQQWRNANPLADSLEWMP